MPNKRLGGLIVVSAPSGAGKTTLCGTVANTEERIEYAVSYTTRSPRAGETDEKDYFFVTEERFKQMSEGGEFAEWAQVHNHHYGTHEGFIRGKMEEGVDVLLDVDVQGAAQLKERFPEGVFIFVLPPSWEVLKERLNKRRSDTPEEIERRIRVAQGEIEKYRGYKYRIINDQIHEAVRDLKRIVFAERLRWDRSDPEWIKKQFIEKFNR